MVTGWANPETARRYAAFSRRHPMYADTSRDLVALAEVAGDATVVDLCCGTGTTAQEILQWLGRRGRIVAIDRSAPMLAEAAAAVPDPRVQWVHADAEAVADHASGADAVICNSAFWQTPMRETAVAVAVALRPGGRFVFNIGRQFIVMPFTDEELDPSGPSLFDYMAAFATIDYDHVDRRRPGAGGALGELQVKGLLEHAGLTVSTVVEKTYTDTVERQRDWLAIPVFTERTFPTLSYEQRMACLDKAYARMDRGATSTSRWMVFVAVKP